MKKLVLLLASLFLLGGCSSEFIKEFSYTPKAGLDYDPALDPDAGNEGGGSEQGGSQGGEGGGQQGGGEQSGDEDGEEKLMCTYNIYFDYSHTTKYNPVTKKDEEKRMNHKSTRRFIKILRREWIFTRIKFKPCIIVLNLAYLIKHHKNFGIMWKNEFFSFVMNNRFFIKAYKT